MDKLITKWTCVICLKTFKVFDNTAATNYIKSGTLYYHCSTVAGVGSG